MGLSYTFVKRVYIRGCVDITIEYLSWRGTGTYPVVGGADISSETSPLLFVSGFMIPLLSGSHYNLSLLLVPATPGLFHAWLVGCSSRILTTFSFAPFFF